MPHIIRRRDTEITISAREYAIPGTQRRHIGEKTLEARYYAWRREGIAGLAPKARADRGQSRIAVPIQQAVLAAKRDNPRRSVRQIVRLLEAASTVASASLPAIADATEPPGAQRLSAPIHSPTSTDSR